MVLIVFGLLAVLSIGFASVCYVVIDNPELVDILPDFCRTGRTTLTPGYQTALATVIATSWH
ncbi:hypothetical protein [Herbaspirillum sp. C9C3]|uniref:hypothetical protein n=1 Tax=Herbaspirillum sp. C9C3 TaxID=2735271 RepID=UPI001811FBD7|nr:hypothetical protein [Herbaspirillum sp. C9C3]NUT59905.1 hypothetical protein [Herbaspirillum sp. C9C3]